MKNFNPILLNKKIFYYEDVILNHKEIIEKLESTDFLINQNSTLDYVLEKWQSWHTDNEQHVFGLQKRVNDSLRYLTNSPLHSQLMDIIKNIEEPMRDCCNDYAKRNNIDIGILSPMCITKYNEGSFMGPHVDSYDEYSSETISVVVYLNDNYEGGEIEFPNHRIKIRPTAGSILIFPSKSPFFHKSNIVAKGIKYISPGFWNLEG